MAAGFASVSLSEVSVSLVFAKTHLASIRSSVFCSLPESFPSRSALSVRHLEKQQKRQPLRAGPERRKDSRSVYLEFLLENQRLVAQKAVVLPPCLRLLSGTFSAMAL